MRAEQNPPRILGPQDGKRGHLGAVGVRFLVDGLDSGGGFSLVEHPMEPWALAAPLHRHRNEDQGTRGAFSGRVLNVGKFAMLCCDLQKS